MDYGTGFDKRIVNQPWFGNMRRSCPSTSFVDLITSPIFICARISLPPITYLHVERICRYKNTKPAYKKGLGAKKTYPNTESCPSSNDNLPKQDYTRNEHCKMDEKRYIFYYQKNCVKILGFRMNLWSVGLHLHFFCHKDRKRTNMGMSNPQILHYKP